MRPCTYLWGVSRSVHLLVIHPSICTKLFSNDKNCGFLVILSSNLMKFRQQIRSGTLRARLDIVIITRKKWQGIATHIVPYYTLSRVHSSRNQKILLGISFFIDFLSFHTKTMGCCKNRFGVVIFAELSFFSVTR